VRGTPLVSDNGFSYLKLRVPIVFTLLIGFESEIGAMTYTIANESIFISITPLVE
jgi:hypothetical protein